MKSKINFKENNASISLSIDKKNLNIDILFDAFNTITNLIPIHNLRIYICPNHFSTYDKETFFSMSFDVKYIDFFKPYFEEMEITYIKEKTCKA